MSSPAAVLAGDPFIDIVVPVHNEARDLEPSVRRLRAYLDAGFPFPARIVIADNASTDGTSAIGRRLAALVPGVRFLRLEEKGRGRALASAWLSSDADILAYMDVDLSTDLDALLPLVAPLISGHSEVAIGSRLAAGARVRRGLKREAISRAYNLILRVTLGVRFRDAQCGFKAVRADVARRLLPGVENRNWFFDTELLVLAERAGLRIHEVPVDWTDDPDSRVDIVATAAGDLRGVWRLLRSRVSGRFQRFAVVGVASTLAYAGLYLLLRGVAPPTVASAAALLLTAVGNTGLNRRYTFGVRGRGGFRGDYLAGLVAFVIALLMTTAAASTLSVAAPRTGRLVEAAALTAANLAATVCRYLLLRGWMDSMHPGRPSPWPPARSGIGVLSSAAPAPARLRPASLACPPTRVPQPVAHVAGEADRLLAGEAAHVS